MRAHEDARLAAASLYSMAAAQAAAGHGSGAIGPRGAWQESTLTLRRALLQLTCAALPKCPALGYRYIVWSICESHWYCPHHRMPQQHAKPFSALVGRASVVLART